MRKMLRPELPRNSEKPFFNVSGVVVSNPTQFLFSGKFLLLHDTISSLFYFVSISMMEISNNLLLSIVVFNQSLFRYEVVNPSQNPRIISEHIELLIFRLLEVTW